MKKPHPFPYEQLPISREVYQHLTTASLQTAFKYEDWEIAGIAIMDWLAKNSPQSIGLPKATGYQWKDLFLPEGTLLRTIFKGKNYHCLVEQHQITYNGQATTPSGFANLVGGSNRNAWKVIWVLFPGTSTWKRASKLRPNK